MTSWNHAASKAESTDQFEELIADAEVLQEEVPDDWFDKVEVPPPPLRPTPKAVPRAELDDRRHAEDARVARIVVHAVAASMAEQHEARGGVHLGLKRKYIADVDSLVTGSGSSSSNSDMVRVPRSVLKHVLDELDKTSASLAMATQMFASAQNAFIKETARVEAAQTELMEHMLAPS